MTTQSSDDNLRFYQDKGHKWRWRLKGDNNECIGASSQGFATKYNAKLNAILLSGGIASALRFKL